MKQINKNYDRPPLQMTTSHPIWRYLLFGAIGIAFITITINMVFIAYQDCSSLLGNRIYLICLSLITLYGFSMWFNYYILVPQLLLKNKYLAYFIILSIIGFSLPILAIIQEYWVRSFLNLPHRISSYTNPLILVDSFASFMMILICFFGIPIVALLKQWMIKKEQVGQMEYKYLQAEINKLKGQITPTFLSKTLINAEISIKTNSEKTSDMLMKLGQLLRYQLYDCNRDKVLLKSEINFLTCFLDLEKLNRDLFQYQMHTEGDLNKMFVCPMLFISIIQYMIEDSTFLKLSFQAEDKLLSFECRANNDKEPIETDFRSIRKSLELQYSDKHTLSLKKGIVILQLNISE